MRENNGQAGEGVESSPQDETGILRILVEALRESDPDGPTIQEQETGWFLIDGHFNLMAASKRLSEKLRKREA